MKKTFLCSIFVAFIASSCTNDNSSTLSEPTKIVGPVTYNNNVKAIIDNNCINCHGNVPTNNAPFSLTTYADVKSKIESIENRISKADGDSQLMPQGGPRLPQTSINIIMKWQNDGLIQ